MKTPLILLLAVTIAFTPGCGTTGGIAVADALESAANQRIIATAVQVGVASLFASFGDKIPASAQAPLSSAAAAVITGVASGAVSAAAEALRTKQSTAVSSAPGALTAAMVNQGDLPPAAAAKVAQSVATLTAQGVPADTANEAVATVLDKVAASTAKAGN
jgi:hypothetical protein